MCAIVAPDLFGSDEEGYGTVLVDGTLPADQEEPAHKAQASCPERAVLVED
jgi:ferredoxin